VKLQQNLRLRLFLLSSTITCALLFAIRADAQNAPLSSWNDGAAKQAIIKFVREVTTKPGTNYVAPQDRIATFDQDGTLWVEHPLYTQAFFTLARVHELAPQHPEWRKSQPFEAVLANDHRAIAKFSESDWERIVAATHAGMTSADFQKIVKRWLVGATDPRFHQPYTRLVYRPMLELMEFLRDNGFKTYIVTGGGQEFVRGLQPGCLWNPTGAGHRFQHFNQIPVP
jgi:haloacid dehalogenase-like hydrolase